MKHRAVWLVVSLAIGVPGCSTAVSDGPRNALRNGPTGPSEVGAGAEGLVDIERVRVFIRDGQPQALVEGPLGDGRSELLFKR